MKRYGRSHWISYQANTYESAWSHMLDSALKTPDEGKSFGRMVFKPPVYFPRIVQTVLRGYWSCSGGSWWPKILLIPLIRHPFVHNHTFHVSRYCYDKHDSLLANSSSCVTAENDPLHFRPNPENLVSKVKLFRSSFDSHSVILALNSICLYLSHL